MMNLRCWNFHIELGLRKASFYVEFSVTLRLYLIKNQVIGDFYSSDGKHKKSHSLICNKWSVHLPFHGFNRKGLNRLFSLKIVLTDSPLVENTDKWLDYNWTCLSAAVDFHVPMEGPCPSFLHWTGFSFYQKSWF